MSEEMLKAQTDNIEAAAEAAAEKAEAAEAAAEAAAEKVEAAEAAVEAAAEAAAEKAEAAEAAAEAAAEKAEAAEAAAETVAEKAEAAEPAAEAEPAKPAEPAETMEDFKEELEQSYKEHAKKRSRGFVDDGSANAEKWEELRQKMEDKEVINVKVKEIVKGGAIAFVDDMKAFIPASQIALNYVEKLEEFVGKHIDTYIITVDPEKRRLVLSAKELLRERRDAERKARMEKYVPGAIVEGVVESLKDYGAFVKLEDGVSGLLHVSQISRQRIKHPGVVLQEGQTVKVKIRDTANGKISLSMKALEEDAERPAREPREPRAPRENREGREPREGREDKSDFHYKNSAPVTTGLGDLLKGLDLKN